MPLNRGIVASSICAAALWVAACGTTTTTPVAVAVVEVTPETVQLIEGESRQLSVSLEDAAGNLLSGRPVSWRSANQTVADVDAEGRVRALGPGVAVITATSEGASGSSTVTVRGRAAIRISSGEVLFEATRGEASPPPSSVEITNGGESTLNELAASVTYVDGAAGWLAASLSSTRAPATLALEASVTGMPTGVHTARVDVTSPVAGNSPQSVQVVFRVLEPPPVISVSSGSVLFGALATTVDWFPAGPVQITNAGGDVLDGLAVDLEIQDRPDITWLRATLSSAVAPATLQLEGRAGTLPVGAYAAVARITAPAATNTPVTVPVCFVVEPRIPDGVDRDCGHGAAGP